MTPAPKAEQAGIGLGKEREEEIHLAWRGALKACGVSEADRDAIAEVVIGMVARASPRDRQAAAWALARQPI